MSSVIAVLLIQLGLRIVYQPIDTFVIAQFHYDVMVCLRE